ncbi:MAG: FAD-dependent oxidoreductase [Candidatus Accumulibacter sp.]|nr:FAD-dependent oxidoreductase [Accumulibacter sp.]
MGGGAAVWGLALAGRAGGAAADWPPGAMSGGNLTLAHRLRDGPPFLPPDETVRVGALIVGAGIGGLSAAWRLKRAGFDDFVIVELEETPGGNARAGRNAISRYPLAAHYLPLPNPEARAVRALLADLGALRGDPDAPEPLYDERYLCHAPQERLYRLGVWQEGLVPRLGLSPGELAEQERFFARMDGFRAAHDAAGRRAFALPSAYSADAPEWAGLDALTMHAWMLREGFTAPSLHWYVNYACRDDYGTDYRAVSAWAGIHYFACRIGRGGEGAGDAVLTAPEGNGWLVDGLLARLGERHAPRCGEMLYALEQTPGGVRADVWNAARRASVRYEAEHLVWAAPLFLLPRVAPDLPGELREAIAAMSHAPWLVANLSLSAPPAPGAGQPLSWDNVMQDSPSLGYVTATHQTIRVAPGGPTVLTYYHALSDAPPAQARERLLTTPRRVWAETILRDLARAHRDIGRLVTRIDIERHGHAMRRPTPGFRAHRRALAAGWGRVLLAHADASGLSLFEEANYQGVRAAETLLAAQGGRLKERLA